MENQKINYHIHWRQSYDTWFPSQAWIDEAVESIVEFDLANKEHKEALDLIDKIRKL